MKLDMHTHGKLAKKLPFSAEYTKWLFKEARNAGLDSLCLTEHFNTRGFREIYGYIVEHYEQEGDTFVTKEGLRIFPGMEVDIAEGGHTLVTGPMEVILELNRRLEPYKEKGKFLPFVVWADMAREYPVLFGAGHPYRNGSHIPELPLKELIRFDYLELNGKDLAVDQEGTRLQMKKLSVQLQKPVAAGSDTHQSIQYGCVYNELEQTVTTVQQLKEEIYKGNYQIRTGEMLAFQVETAGLLKRSLKEIYTLGGDYVKVLFQGAEL